MKVKTIDAALLLKMLQHGTAKLANQKAEVDALNVFPVPDGDTGTNMSLTMTQAIKGIQVDADSTVGDVATKIAKGSLMGARGNSGVILSQIFRGFANYCQKHDSLTVKDVAQALSNSAATAYKAVLKPVEGTILTVIKEVSEHALEISEQSIEFDSFLSALIRRGHQTLANTPNLLPILKQAGVVDAGGKGLLIILEGFYEVLTGDAVITPSDQPIEHFETHSAQAHLNTEDITFSYCTEFIVRGENLNEANLQHDIMPLGDSMVYVPDDDLIKVHIHTNEPGSVMQHALKYGELIKIKIENMKEQHSQLLQPDDIARRSQLNVPQIKKTIGIVAVAMGEGMVEILKDLGVDVVIEGGQTMNPSTADIQKAIDQANAERVIVMPNNSNIILAAEQSTALSDKQAAVLPTTSVMQCITAMLSYNPEASLDDNLAAMSDVLSDVKTIQVTYAVRDSELNGVAIKKDHYIGILDGKIVCSHDTIERAVLDAVKRAYDEDSEILSIFYGADSDEASANGLAEQIAQLYPDLEVDVQRGNQPVYHYLISVE